MSKVRVHTHVQCSQEIKRPAPIVWKILVEEIGECGFYAKLDYRIDPLDDPGAYRGGYHLLLETPELRDEIRVWKIESDDEAMRLIMYAEYLSPQANGLTAFATYRAAPSEAGGLAILDCHFSIDLATEPGAARPQVAQDVAALRKFFEDDTAQMFAAFKTQLEQSVDA